MKESISFILEESRNSGRSCGRFDVECLATALEISIPLVTDDRDLVSLSKDYEVVCMSTLQLLKLLLDSKRVTIEDIQNTVYMWDYMDDLPGNFRSSFLKLFGVNPDRYN